MEAFLLVLGQLQKILHYSSILNSRYKGPMRGDSLFQQLRTAGFGYVNEVLHRFLIGCVWILRLVKWKKGWIVRDIFLSCVFSDLPYFNLE